MLRRRFAAVVALGLAALQMPSVDLGAQGTAAQPPVRRSAAERRALFAKWASLSTPLAGPPSAIGFYAAGCLQGAQTLPLDGDGYAVMRPSRRRYFGHPALIDYLTRLAAATHERTGRLLLIGDMAPPRGGPMLSGHASHQTGLDADVWLTTRTARPTASQRERLGAPSYVVGRKRLRPAFTRAQASLLAEAANHDEINRIFVSPPIKRYMCREYPEAPWLYRLRGWWGHEDHFHVRLLCPSGDASCTDQDPLNPADNGCGAELDWWFSAEADQQWRDILASTAPRQFPELPAACSAMTAAR
jgi:penicillin-insensitive murein endopeptidase